MRLIGLAVVLAVSLTIAPLTEAQPAGKVARIGVLMNLYSPDAGPPHALRQRLRDLLADEPHGICDEQAYQPQDEGRCD